MKDNKGMRLMNGVIVFDICLEIVIFLRFLLHVLRPATSTLHPLPSAVSP